MNLIKYAGGKVDNSFVYLPPFKFREKNHSSFLLKFTGLNTIDDVRGLTGLTVYTLKSYLLQNHSGDNAYFFLFQLQSCRVYNNNVFIGVVTNLYNFGASDLVEIELVNEENRKILVPFLETYISKIDVKEKKEIFLKNIEVFF